MKHYLKTFLLVISVILIFAGNIKADDFTDAIMKAKKNLKTAMNTYDEKSLLKVRGEFERILQLKKHDWIINYYLALVDYALANTAMSGNEPDLEKLKKYNKSALDLIDKSILVRDDFADSYILKYALNFNRWIYEQDKMNDIMAQTEEAKTKAEKLDPTNPRFYLVDGIGTFYMPEAFGGGASKSVPLFEKSLDLFSKRMEKETYYPDWGKDMTYGYLILSYNKRDDDGDKEKVKEFYEKATTEFPESTFLKNYVSGQIK